MLLDVSPPTLEVLVVDGILECDPESTDALVLRVKLVVIASGGRFLCGSDESPFGLKGSSLELRLVEDHQKEIFRSISNRMLVYGELRFVGRPYTSWTRLNHTAPAGATSLMVQGYTDWSTNQELILSPSVTITDTERVRTTHVQHVTGADGFHVTVLHLSKALLFPHLGVSEQYGGKVLNMYAEVGLLSRAITIKSEPEASAPAVIHTPSGMNAGDELGGLSMSCSDGEPSAHVKRSVHDKLLFDGDCLTLHDSAFTPLDGSTHTVALNDGTSFEIPMRGVLSQFLIKDKPSSSNWLGQRAGGGLIRMQSVLLEDVALRVAQDDHLTQLHSLSVVSNTDAYNPHVEHHIHWASQSSAIDLRGPGAPFLIEHFVIVGPSTQSWASVLANKAMFASNLVIGGGLNWPCFDGSSAIWLRHNAAAGCASAAYSQVPDEHTNNTGHNAGICVNNLDSTRMLHNFTLWRCEEFAIWTAVQFPRLDSLVVENIMIADSRNGLYLSYVTSYLPIGSVGSRIYVNDSLIVGRSRSVQTSGCQRLYATRYQSITGLWAPFFGTHLGPVSGGNVRSCGRLPEPFNTPQGLVRHGEVHVDGVHFVGFDGQCGTRMYAIEVNPNCLDSNPPTYFRRISWHSDGEHSSSDADDHRFYMPPTNPAHISLAGCFTMDCGGLINALFHDEDGSLTGVAGASILARAEGLSPVRANGQPTPYRIPQKLLYDPWPSDRRRLQQLEEEAYVRPCDPSMATYDPACRARKRRPHEVAYQGYGVFRGEYSASSLATQVHTGSRGRCTSMLASGNKGWNAWHCTPDVILPARLVIESLDQDWMSRNVVPVALQSGGYVTLLNGGKAWPWFGLLRRPMVFFTSVATGRQYDLAFTAENPKSTRFLLPNYDSDDRICIGVFFPNPQRLVVRWNGRYRRDLNPSGYDFQNLVRPTADMPCGTNAFVGWENKLYFVACGTAAGDEGLTIKTLPVIRLAITSTQLVDVGVDELFDAPKRLMTHIVALFGIPRFRVRRVTIVPDSEQTGYGTYGRRLQFHPMDGNISYKVNKSFFHKLQSSPTKTVILEINIAHPCDNLNCGISGECRTDVEGRASCACEKGWLTPYSCDQGDCVCSVQECHHDCRLCSGTGPNDCTLCHPGQLLQMDNSCGTECGPNAFASAGKCNSCNSLCLYCFGAMDNECTACSLTRGAPYLHLGQCVSECPPGTWTNAQRECIPCDASCRIQAAA